MDVLRRSDFKTMPWPNGQGVAHEIAIKEVDGQPVWRLSLADVIGECVFSKFTGMTRVTTVVSGAGMDLEDAADSITLRPLMPVSFSGEMPLTGKLVGGPVENLNVVFDASKFRAEVSVETVPLTLPIFLKDTFMAFVLEGQVEFQDFEAGKGDCLLDVFGRIAGKGKVILIRLEPLDKGPRAPKTGA